MNRFYPSATCTTFRFLEFAAFNLLLFPILTLASSPTKERPLPDSSLYQVSSVWENDLGDSLKLASLRGKPRLLTLFFSKCESICPAILGQLKWLDQETPSDLSDQFGFVLVTFDIQRDSAQSLKAYRSQMGLDSKRWTLLRSNADNTRELALLLGVEYQPGAKGQMDHNGLIALLDAEGRVVQKMGGIADRKAFLQTMRNMVTKP
jgi:protein SCO1